MMKKVSSRKGFYYPSHLVFSDAYRRLTVSARELLHLFIDELTYTYRKAKDGRHKEWTNNGEVSVTESQFKKRLGKCSGTYLKSRDLLITVGFIKQTHRGGIGAGDRAKYEVLISGNAMPSKNERWRDYPKKDWSREIPEHKNQLIGIKTRWKKGESGRKL